MDDQELIKLYLSGDSNAFNTLVRRYHKPLYNYILKLVRDRDAADDLAQTVFIRCMKSLKRLNDLDSFVPWLYKIAINLVRDYWRRKKEVLSLDDESDSGNLWENIVTSDSNPQEKAEAEQRAELVKRALAALPPEQKEVLVLKIYQGLKFTEIAQIVDAPLNTVKSRMYYGLTAMKKTFQSWNLLELRHHEV